MAAKNIEVDSDVLRSVHGRSVKEHEDMLLSQVSMLTPEIEGLSAVWEGPNHDDFMKVAESGMADLSGFIRSIGVFLDAWKSAYEAYEKCESSVSQHIG